MTRRDIQMQTASHTPGPWSLTEREDCDDYRLQSSDGEFIAYVDLSRYPDDRSDPEQEANARLIAAAPDLLAASKRLVELTGLSSATLPAGSGWLALMDAIARAEGR